MTDQKSYEVGYGRPPKEHQFEKGRSGNPKGRPKKKPIQSHQEPSPDAFYAILRREIEREIKVTDQHGTVTVTMIDAIVRKMVAAGVTGSRLERRDMLREFHRWRKELERERDEKSERQLAAYEKLRGYKRKYEARWNRTGGDRDIEREEGRRRPKIFPHPDDIILEPVTRDCRIVGPRSEDDAEIYEIAADNLERTFILSVAMERAGFVYVVADPVPESIHQTLPICEPGMVINFAAIAAMCLNRDLPPSYRLTDNDWIRLHEKYDCMSDKALKVAVEELGARIDAFNERLTLFEDDIAGRPPPPNSSGYAAFVALMTPMAEALMEIARRQEQAFCGQVI